MTSTQFAPGCFGSSLIYRATDDGCKRCKFSEQCGLKSTLNKEALRLKLSGLPNDKSPFDVKVERTVSALRKLGLSIRQNIKDKNNPFNSEQATLYIFCDIMIEINKLGRKFTSDWVENVVARKAGIDRSKGVKILCAAFVELGVLRNDSGFLWVDL